MAKRIFSLLLALALLAACLPVSAARAAGQEITGPGGEVDVTVGIMGSDEVEILSGLTEGTTVWYREELDIFDFFAGMSGGGMPSGGRPSGNGGRPTGGWG